MKYRMCLWVMTVSAYISCTQVNKQEALHESVKKDSAVARVKPGSSFSDTLLIQGRAAVFYYPDSLQDLKIKAVTDSSIYKSSVHEMFYQMRNSKMVLAKYYPTLPIKEAKNVRYLLFQKTGAEARLIDLNQKNDARGLFIFDGKKDPELVDMTNIETALDFYFKK